MDPNNTGDEDNFIVYEFKVPDEPLMKLAEIRDEFSTNFNNSLDQLFALVESLNGNPVENPNQATFETPAKRRPKKREAPLSSSVNKIIINRRDKRSKKTDNKIQEDHNNEQKQIVLKTCVKKESTVVVNKDSSINSNVVFTRSRAKMINNNTMNNTTVSNNNNNNRNDSMAKKCSNNSGFSTPKSASRVPRKNNLSKAVIDSSKNAHPDDSNCLFQTPKNSNKSSSVKFNQNNKNCKQKTSASSKRQLGNKGDNSSVPETPKTISSVLSTPSATMKRPDDILKSSVEKVKKAEMNRKAHLECRQQKLREIFIEKKNRLLANQQKQVKNEDKPKQPAKPLVLINKDVPQPIREKNKEKLKKIHQLKLKNDKEVQRTADQLPPVVIGDGSILKTKDMNQKNAAKAEIVSGETKIINNNHHHNCAEELMTSDEHSDIENRIPLVISPIKPDDGSTPKPNLTYINDKTPVPMNHTITKLKQTLINSYQLTPPSRPYDNYEISALVDSDDEEGQQLAQKQSHIKPVPSWAKGTLFAAAVRQQFEKSPEEFRRLVAEIFPNPPQLPVNLEALGLTATTKYQQRTSSVCWDTQQELYAHAHAHMNNNVKHLNNYESFMSEVDD